jgi:diguanylate cyclase (GGDEF)-like protein
LIRLSPPRFLVLLGVALLALHAGRDLFGAEGSAFAVALGKWFQPAVFMLCGVTVLLRARRGGQRTPWLLLGAGLTLYATGSIYFNIASRGGVELAFPSMADALWLLLYPLTYASLAVLLHRRLTSLRAAVWLDGLIAGGVVAAVVAALVFNSVFDLTSAGGAASVARLAYPVGDLIALGVVIAAWSVGGHRPDPFWVMLGTGFGLLALGDSSYVVQAAHGTWQPGNALDYPYAIATLLIAGAAWVPQRRERDRGAGDTSSVRIPVASGLAALTLTSVSVLIEMNPLATVLSLLTMLAVVMRLGSSQGRLNRQSRALATLAATDPLTGLPNHRTVHERLAAELRRAKGIASPLAVVALDIDHFKTLNDTYGHTEGDAALQAIARVLSDQVSGRRLVGRVGGEEFVLLLPDTDAGEAFAVAERCRAALMGLTVHGAGVSCSAGVASFPDDDETGVRLLELADGALYWAKRSGRAQTRRFDPREVVLLSGAEQRAQVQAVLDCDHALTPVFQPIVELTTGRIAGYEALSRFTLAEPARAPDLWFAQARRCGLGAALEAKAVAAALAVPDRPAGTFLSLNVSPSGLVSREVAAVLPEDLTDIVIELTEDEVFSSDIALDAQLSDLRDRGARIAVDDAGAGYAGLQQVVRIAPEILKIDRSLITSIDIDASKMALLEALARFASTTGAAVCGEGIEKLEELRMLARADVTYAQGYALGRPGPPWPTVDASIAGHTTAQISVGMRIARAAAPGLLSLGEVASELGQVRTPGELDRAVNLIERLLHADEVTVSRVVAGERCVESVTLHATEEPGSRYAYDDYPTTEHVVRSQVIGQLAVDDPGADPAERRLLAELGFSSLLLAPIVRRGETVGLLEVYRTVERPWTSVEIDSMRLITQALAAAIDVTAPGGDLPWRPQALGAGLTPQAR